MDVLSIHCNRLEHLTDRLMAFGFTRGEFYHFNPSDLSVLRAFLCEHHIVPSVHAPLRKVPWYPYPVTWSFLTTDGHEEERQLSLRLTEEAMQDAKEIGARYVVVHYPTPASAHAQQMSLAEQRALAWDSAARLSALSAKFQVPIHIEGFGPSPFMDADFLCDVLKSCPNLRYCFDTGHMRLAEWRGEVDYFGFLARLAPYIGSVHVWNTRSPDDYRTYHHLPVHPDLSPEDGWVDIERVVRSVRAVNSEAVFVIEYIGRFPPEFNLDDREGIEWFKELVQTTPTAPLPVKNVVLTGFMATGKSAVGREIARRTGRTFVDMDELLEQRLGKTIREVFDQEGEAVFRDAESELAHELALEQGLIIATGGGTLVCDSNREALQRNGILICLNAAVEEILRRLQDPRSRPMLDGNNLSARIIELLERRQPVYAKCPYQIDTTGLTIEQVAEVVMNILALDVIERRGSE